MHHSNNIMISISELLLNLDFGLYLPRPPSGNLATSTATPGVPTTTVAETPASVLSPKLTSPNSKKSGSKSFKPGDAQSKYSGKLQLYSLDVRGLKQ